jgi:hypothetical protein
MTAIERIRRDNAIRSLPLWIAVGILTSTLLMALLAHSAEAGQAEHLGSGILLAGWLCVTPYLASGFLRKRCTGFDLTMPIPGRQLWLSHVLAVVLGGWTIVACFALIIAGLAGLLSDRFIMPLTTLAILGILFSGTLLAAVLVQAQHRGLQEIPRTSGASAQTLGRVLSVLPLLLLIGRAPLLTIPLFLTALLLAWRVYRSTPDGMTVTGTGLLTADGRTPGKSTTARMETGTNRRGRILLPLAITRVLTMDSRECLIYPISTFMISFVIGGGLAIFSRDPDLKELAFVYLPLGGYILISGAGPGLKHLHRLDPLPIRRGLLFACLVFPGIIMFGAGYAIGSLALHAKEADKEMISWSEARPDSYTSLLSVPLRAYHIAWRGHAPRIVAPWGESCAPATLAPFRFAPTRFYLPYTIPTGATARFAGWQIARAVQSIYGASIPPEEITALYLANVDRLSGPGNGSPIGGRRALRIRNDHPGIRPRPIAMAPIVMAAAFIPWLLGTNVLLRTYRPSVPKRARQRVFFSLLGLFFIFVIAAMSTLLSDAAANWSIRGFLEILATRLSQSPFGMTGAWAASLTLIVAVYSLTRAQFLKMEIPTIPAKYSLIERIREES